LRLFLQKFGCLASKIASELINLCFNVDASEILSVRFLFIALPKAVSGHATRGQPAVSLAFANSHLSKVSKPKLGRFLQRV
jgi:hypothetical protein